MSKKHNAIAFGTIGNRGTVKVTTEVEIKRICSLVKEEKSNQGLKQHDLKAELLNYIRVRAKLVLKILTKINKLLAEHFKLNNFVRTLECKAID